MWDRMGVRGRLLVAFFGISAFALVAAAAAMISFIEVGEGLNLITQKRVPSALASQELSRQTERIIAAAPALLTVTTLSEYEKGSNKLTTEVERLVALLADVESSDIDTAAHESLAQAIRRLTSNLDAIDRLIAQRILVSDQKKELLRGVAQTHSKTQRLLKPWMLVMEAEIGQWRAAVNDPGQSPHKEAAQNIEMARLMPSHRSLQKAQFMASVINDTLKQAASTNDRKGLKILAFRLDKILREIQQLTNNFDPKLQKGISPRLDEFRGFVVGEESIPHTRTRELSILAEAEGLLAENRELSRTVTEAVDHLVEDAKQDIADANREALSVHNFSTWVLIVVVVLSLISSALIVWLYVERNLIARLTALSDSMLSVAGGNLKVPLPATRGGDEISRMAEALTVFRDTAIEVEEKNLREIEETRRRLVDAIESTSEGFAFYDNQDRLVICNTRYKELLYPASGVVIEPGTTFETIIRRAAEGGLITSAEGRVDEWVAERLARHRDPGEPQLQQRGDGRWILISERKTGDGGTVAIYADITEIKQREVELAEKSSALEEKSNALEQLSNQLAKYLSPQVYESIFSGKQEVKIASRRKKLSVVFSDIVGFTQTTDNLEAEELSNLLNHYLTEMSEIALKYGATIDKYIGDAMLMFFGDPETKGPKEDAKAGVMMAIAMQQRMRELEQEWRDRGLERPFQVRIGITTGFCTVGNFGSQNRMDYTIIGNEVNLAARLEASAEPEGILIAHETYSLVKDSVMAEEQPPLTVKGFDKPIHYYKVVGMYDDLAEEGRIVRHQKHGIQVFVDPDKLAGDDRGEAIEALKDALAKLES